MIDTDGAADRYDRRNQTASLAKGPGYYLLELCMATISNHKTSFYLHCIVPVFSSQNIDLAETMVLNRLDELQLFADTNIATTHLNYNTLINHSIPSLTN